MTDLFLDPKVLDFSGDKYQLILHTLRWARAMKAKGSPEPMPALIEAALRDIVEKKVTAEEIMANKIVAPVETEEAPAVVSVGEDGDPTMKLADDADDEKKKAKKKKKKDEV
ncbi:MAG TPA: hypothetical protein VMU17_00145 [Elusimicrobiota bacterium]|nr:hypothetical protein [Elusimicrobiota bacterium]